MVLHQTEVPFGSSHCEVILVNDIVLYSNQPFLAAGLRVALAEDQRFRPASVCTTIAQLLDQIREAPASLVLMDLTSEVTLDVLKQVRSERVGASVILWVDAISTEFASQVIGMGVRGILRKTLSIELQLKCLQKVADGELWLEKSLSHRLLTTIRVSLTPRERQLVGLLAQGMKNKEIAYALGITEGTVKVYLSRLFQKVGVKDRLDLALFAVRNMVGSGSMPTSASRPAPADFLPAAPLFVPGFISKSAA
jgi:two-component system nitrate/nitrite response regulator NarL